MAADTATPEQRIAELEDALKEKERRLAEVKADLDKANELVERMPEHVEDSSDLINSWIEAFGMELNESGSWTYAEWVAAALGWRAKYMALLREWNRFVPEYNAAARPPRNVGRPLVTLSARPSSSCTNAAWHSEQ